MDTSWREGMRSRWHEQIGDPALADGILTDSCTTLIMSR
jgi:hypothetical protein